MASDLDDLKICIRSLLTSSPKPINILQLQKDYLEQEGCSIPYKSLGFHSVIDLLQNMNDVLTVPPNPNKSSMLTLVVGEKTNHLRMLVVKQKINTKRKKGNSAMIRPNRYHNSRSDNNRFNKAPIGYNKLNQSSSSANRSYGKNIFPGYSSGNSQLTNNNYVNNTGSVYHQSNKSSLGYNQLDQSSPSTTKHDSSLNSNCYNQSTGYMTDKLRSDIEKYILENQEVITFAKLKEIVINHPDYSVLNVKSVEHLKERVKGFLDINCLYVTLNPNRPVIHHNTDILINPSGQLSDADQLSYNSSLLSTSVINHINGNDKNVINSKQYEQNDQKTVTELNNKLKMIEFQEVSPHRKNQYDNKMDSSTDKSMESLIDYIDICKNESMIRNLQDVYESNSVIAKKKHKINIQTLKELPENKKNKDVDTGLVNGIKSELGSNTQISLNSPNNSNSFSHSTPKENKNVKITLNENHGIPDKVVLNIGRIFNVYTHGMNFENFKFIYKILYNIIFNPNDLGFVSITELFKILDKMVELRNNVLYTKTEFKLSENIDFKNCNEYLVPTLYLNNEVRISLNIEQPLLSFDQDNSKTEMVLVEAYNPCLFYLQLCDKIAELDCLMKQMQTVYEVDDKKYLVEPKQILPGSFYASSYTSFSNMKQWYRVRVLRMVCSTTIEIILVDYGTINTIPITELRFLSYEFCNLPCQAIHCCLTGYNQLDSIAPEVTKALLEIININKQVFVMVDDHFILNKQWQILHVTLFQNKLNSEKLENINNKLTIWHLNR